MPERLDSVPMIEWGDREAASIATRRLLDGLADSPAELRGLVGVASARAALLSASRLEDEGGTLAIYDAAERGFRICLDIACSARAGRPHGHGSPFSMRVLAGAYYHRWYGPSGNAETAAPMPWLTTEERVGACYTLLNGQSHMLSAEGPSAALILYDPSRQDQLQCMSWSASLGTPKAPAPPSQSEYERLLEKALGLGLLWRTVAGR